MKKLKGIYLAAYRAFHPNYDIVYQDINGLRDVGGNMLDVCLDDYDYIIASPPCNWWSKANYRRDESPYSLRTKWLLPAILYKLLQIGKPFIVENVRNDSRFHQYHLFDLPLYVYTIGRHTYWTNCFLSLDCLQVEDNVIYTPQADRQGGENVHNVIETWLEDLHFDINEV